MTSRPLPTGSLTVRPRAGWVFLFFTMLVTGPVLVAAFVPVRATTAAIAVTAVALTVLSYIYFVAPRVVVAEDAIRVENPWRTHVVPWGSLVDVETRFDLTLVTTRGKVHVQAAPTPSARSAMRGRVDPAGAGVGAGAGARRGGGAPGAASTGNDAASVADVILERWQDLLASGTLDEAAEPVTTPRVTHLALTLGGLALAAVLWLLA